MIRVRRVVFDREPSQAGTNTHKTMVQACQLAVGRRERRSLMRSIEARSLDRHQRPATRNDIASCETCRPLVDTWRQGRSYQSTADHGFDSRKGTSSLPQRGNVGGSDFADVLKIA